MPLTSLLPTLFAMLFLCAASTASAASPDFAAARTETVAILQDLIRLDTSNPPGNETLVAQYIQKKLAAEGIASDIVGADPARGNVIARLRGSGKKKPLLILGHADVVGVQAEQWSVEPFAGVIKDGYIWGRGAVDDKDTVAAGLMVFLMLHRAQLALDRDVIYVAEAAEESGANEFGVGYLIANHWDKIAAEFAIAEGGTMPQRAGKVRYVGVATTEKQPNGVTLVARGTSGHGSVPRPDNAIIHLAEAVAKVGRWQTPMRLNETTREFFSRLADISPPEEAAVYRGLLDPAAADEAQRELQKLNLGYYSMLRTSVSPNVIEGGFRYNVIPGEARATLDVRAVPDEDLEALFDAMRALIDDSTVEAVTRRGGRPSAAPSPLGSEMFKAIEATQQQMFPGAVTLPMMLTGATDNAQLRAAGVLAYGIGSPTEENELRAHANDERISIDSLGTYVEFMYRVVAALALAD